MLMGRPVVATTLGMEALEVTNWRELVVADQPADFAAAVLKLLRDATARERIGAAGRELVMRRYTWDACAASYDTIYTHSLRPTAALALRLRPIYRGSQAATQNNIFIYDVPSSYAVRYTYL